MTLPASERQKLLQALDYVENLFPDHGVIVTVAGPADGDSASNMSPDALVSVLRGLFDDVGFAKSSIEYIPVKKGRNEH